MAGKNEIVPFAMKPVGLELDLLHLRSTNLAPGGIFAPIQSACHCQSLRCGGSRDQVDDRFAIAQRLPAPVGGDEREEPVLDLVPPAGAGREATDRDGEPGLIGELLQLELPQPQPDRTASTAAKSSAARRLWMASPTAKSASRGVPNTRTCKSKFPSGR